MQEITEVVEFAGCPDMAQKLRDKFCECHVYNLIKCKYKNEAIWTQVIKLACMIVSGLPDCISQAHSI